MGCVERKIHKWNRHRAVRMAPGTVRTQNMNRASSGARAAAAPGARRCGVDVGTQGNKVFFTANGCRLPLMPPQKMVAHSQRRSNAGANPARALHKLTTLVPLGTLYNAPWSLVSAPKHTPSLAC